MYEPETVQFFQFDSDGNMFMFPPGSGCSGQPILVRPGEELFQPNKSQFYQEKTEICNAENSATPTEVASR